MKARSVVLYCSFVLSLLCLSCSLLLPLVGSFLLFGVISRRAQKQSDAKESENER